MSLQYWGQPFIASGLYSNHKQITNQKASEYKDRFSVYTPSQISLHDDEYTIDENGGNEVNYSFDKKDFNVREFLSNLVVRWEYSPGSSLFLVWNQTISSSDKTGRLDLKDDLQNLFSGDDHKPHNVFLLKFSYRFGL